MKYRPGDRVEEIFKKINTDKLPFDLEPNKLNELGLDIADELMETFKGLNLNPSLKWCLSTIKKAKVFTLIYQANERGLTIYKEEIAKKLTEYSYKTIATIVDEGINKGYYISLDPVVNENKKISDKKVKNIRPSIDLISAFYNWNISRIATVSKIINKYK